MVTAGDSEEDPIYVHWSHIQWPSHFNERLSRLRQQLFDVSEVMDGFWIEKMTFEPYYPLSSVVNFRSYFDREDNQIHIQSYFDLFLFDEAERMYFATETILDSEQVQVEMKGAWREAKAKLSFKMNSENSLWQWNWEQFPVKRLLHLASYDDPQTTQFFGLWNPQFLWFNCKSDWSWSPHNIFAVQLNSCELYGDIGRILLNGKVTGDGQKSQPENLTLDFEKVSLQKLIKSFNKIGPTGVLRQFGEIGGKVEIRGWQDLEYKGQLKNLELKFSRGPQRDVQRVQQLRGKISYKDNRVSGVVDKMELEEGEFEGQLTFNLNSEFSGGGMQISIDKLRFSPTIEELILNGQASPIQIYGKSELREGHIVQWQGSIGIENLESQGVKWNQLKWQSEYKNEKLQGQLSANTIEITDKAPFLKPLLTLMGDEEDSSISALHLTQFSGRVSSNKKVTNWKSVSALTANSPLQLDLIQKDDNFIEGRLRWKGKSTKFKTNEKRS